MIKLTNDPDNGKLNACSCGAKAASLFQITYGGTKALSPAKIGFGVECPACRKMIFLYETKDEAINAWNA